jgi:hypothetical protein
MLKVAQDYEQLAVEAERREQQTEICVDRSRGH